MESMEQIQIIKVKEEDKKACLALLLLADEQESMVDRYLQRGDMFRLVALNRGEVLAQCVVTKEADGVYDIKNIAVLPSRQRSGLGRRMLAFLESYYEDWQIFYVGTGESPSTMNFYQSCGFVFSHRITDFFTKNYDHPLWEDGCLLTDMIYFKKTRR